MTDVRNPKEIVMISSKRELKILAKGLGVRKDWHEPDEQGVGATLTGDHLDNACCDGSCEEYTVIITKDRKEVALVNLALLLAFACDTYDGIQ